RANVLLFRNRPRAHFVKPQRSSAPDSRTHSRFQSKKRSFSLRHPGQSPIFTRRRDWKMNAPHIVSEPSILYFGTPVVLISSANEDGSANLAPMSSAFWLGWRC